MNTVKHGFEVSQGSSLARSRVPGTEVKQRPWHLASSHISLYTDTTLQPAVLHGRPRTSAKQARPTLTAIVGPW